MSKAQLVSFVKNAPVSIAMLDRHMNYLATSVDWMTQYGRGHPDLVGLNHYDLLPDTPETWRVVHERALAGEIIKQVEERSGQADGRKYRVRSTIMPWRDEKDEIAGLMITTETTELERSEEAAAPNPARGPLAVDRAEHPPSTSLAPPSGTQDQALVLVVEDNPAINHFICESLSSECRVAATFGGNERLASLIEKAPDGIFVVAPDGRYIEVNDAGCRMLGYSREEILQKTSADLISPDELQRLSAMRDALAKGSIYGGEFHLLHKDGHYLPVEISASILPDGRRQAFVRDITERKQSLAALRRAEAISSGILFAAAEAIISVDKDQRIILFNRGAQQLFGYTQAEALGAPLEQLIPERLREAHREQVDQFAASDSTSRVMGDRSKPIYGRRKNGEEFPADAAISKVEAGGETILTVSLRDITEQQRSEQEHAFLAEVGGVLASLEYEDTLQRLARAAVRSLADFAAIFVIDESGDPRRVALACKDPAHAHSMDLIMQLDNRPRPDHPIWRILEARRPLVAELQTENYDSIVTHPEVLRTFQASKPRWVLGQPLLWANQCAGVLALLSISRPFDPKDLDLTQEVARRCALFIENARLHRAEKRATRLRDEVLGIVAHDLRNPLSTVVLQSALLRRRGADTEKQYRKAADVISRAATRMSRIIEDLLDVTRLEAGHLAVEQAAIQARKILADIVDAHHPFVASRSLSLQLVAPDLLPDVWADKERMNQVFENLISNALKFTESGSITVGAEPKEGEILFWVADTGAGIPAENIPHLFDRFWQARKATRSGAGLGLAIVKGIVEAHGGRIWAESKVGSGTTFFFTLPTQPSNKQSSAA